LRPRFRALRKTKLALAELRLGEGIQQRKREILG
jgi:hypothetical protein